jgi:hypothetical protein
MIDIELKTVIDLFDQSYEVHGLDRDKLYNARDQPDDQLHR